MKKLIKSILLTILLVPIFVFADMSGPGPAGYNAKISNPDGADATYINGSKAYHLPYSTKIHVNYEEDDYAIISGSECKSFGCKKSSDYQIKLEDISIDSNKDVEDETILFSNNKYSETLSFNTIDDLNSYFSETHKVYVFRKGVYFYKGPGKKYDKIESLPEIPVGTTLTYKYYTDDYFYTEVKGQKGWVRFPDYSDVEDEDEFVYINPLADVVGTNNKLYLIDGAEMYDSSFKKSIGVTIPSNTTVTFKYQTYEGDFDFYYVIYNGKEGWIKIDENSAFLDVSEFNYTIKALKSLNLYKYSGSNKAVLDSKFGKNKEAKIIYVNNTEAYYVDYNGIKGWVRNDDEDAFLISTNADFDFGSEKNSYSYIRCLKKLYVYDGYKGNRTDKFVEKNDEFKVIYYDSYYSNGYFIDWYYVEKDGEFSWIKSSVKDVEDAKDSVEFIDEIKENVNPEQTIVEDTNDTAETSVKEIKNNLKVTALYYAAGVIILILVTIVIIKLFNKKKNLKGKKVNKKKQREEE